MINCLVIDDEPLAGKGLKEYIDDIPLLNCMGVLHNPSEALSMLDDIRILYLDINMPIISGIDFLKQVKNPPLTIITTAYQQYALQGFELDVVDYLLKPISFPRFLKATTKAIDYLKLTAKEEERKEREDYFFVKCNGILEKVIINEITAVESLANYLIIYTGSKKLIVYLTLKQLKEYLPSEQFIQVHKSFIVDLHKIDKVVNDLLYIEKKEVPLGNNYKDAVMNRIKERTLKR